MSKGKPTPGPWWVVEKGRKQPSPFYTGIIALIGTTPDEKTISVCIGEPGQEFCDEPAWPDEWAANANLIAAAGTAAHECEQLGFDGLSAVKALPELLKALVPLEREIPVKSEDIPNDPRDSDKLDDLGVADVTYGDCRRARDILDALRAAKGDADE